MSLLFWYMLIIQHFSQSTIEIQWKFILTWVKTLLICREDRKEEKREIMNICELIIDRNLNHWERSSARNIQFSQVVCCPCYNKLANLLSSFIHVALSLYSISSMPCSPWVSSHQLIQVVEFQECSIHARQDATIMCLYVEIATWNVYYDVLMHVNVSAEVKRMLAYHGTHFGMGKWARSERKSQL